MTAKSRLITIIITLLLIINYAQANGDIWRRIVRIEGEITDKDNVPMILNQNQSDSTYKGSYSLTLYNNGSFVFSMPSEKEEGQKEFTRLGQAIRSGEFNMMGQNYSLKAQGL